MRQARHVMSANASRCVPRYIVTTDEAQAPRRDNRLASAASQSAKGVFEQICVKMLEAKASIMSRQ